MNRVKITRQHKRRVIRLIAHARRQVATDNLDEALRAIKLALHLNRDWRAWNACIEVAFMARTADLARLRNMEREAAQWVLNAMQLEDAGLLEPRSVDEIRQEFLQIMYANREASNVQH